MSASKDSEIENPVETATDFSARNIKKTMRRASMLEATRGKRNMFLTFLLLTGTIFWPAREWT